MDGKKILITGFSGFVARYFVEYLYSLEINVKIYGIDIQKPIYDIDCYRPRLDIHFQKLDMTDFNKLADLFQQFTPDYILHLAAYSSVAYSWVNPMSSFINNSNIFLNLIKEVQENNAEYRVLSVGSSEEYGNVAWEDLPIRENQPLRPLSPYAVARVSQEMLSKVFSESFHMDIILTRSFNHIGPRQDERFVVPGFISRIINIKQRGEDHGEIETGDLSIIRDFVDVRDVVKAYYILFMNGKSGEIYNICSGKGVTLKSMIELIGNQIGVQVTTKINQKYIRPNENKVVVGSPFKIETELGWQRELELYETIHDMIQYQWNNK